METQRVQMKGVLPYWFVGLSCREKDFCSALAALVGPVQNIFFLTLHYFNFVPVTLQAEQSAVLGRLSLCMCLHRKKRFTSFPSPRDVTNQTPPGQELFSYDVIIPAQGESGSDIPAGDGKHANLFFTVYGTDLVS